MELRCPWPVRCVAHCVTQRFSLGRRLWDEVISTTAAIFRDALELSEQRATSVNHNREVDYD